MWLISYSRRKDCPLMMGIDIHNSHGHWNPDLPLGYDRRSSEAKMRSFTPSENACITEPQSFPSVPLGLFLACFLRLYPSFFPSPRGEESSWYFSLFLFYVCMYVPMCVHTYARGGKRALLSVFLHCCPLCILRRGLSLNQEFWLHSLISKDQGSFHLLYLSTRIKSIHHHTQFFFLMLVLRMWMRPLMLIR